MVYIFVVLYENYFRQLTLRLRDRTRSLSFASNVNDGTKTDPRVDSVNDGTKPLRYETLTTGRHSGP